MQLLVLLAAVAAAIVLFKKVGDLSARIAALEARLLAAPIPGAVEQAISAHAVAPDSVGGTGNGPPPQVEPEVARRVAAPWGEPAAAEALAVPVTVAASPSIPAEAESTPVGPAKAADAPPPRKTVDIDWERTLGVRLPVWGGALMLLIAGFFLINWAIQSGVASLFTPEIRVGLCALASVVLLVAAFVVKRRGIASGDQIATALATSALAVGYGTAFLAGTLFHLVSGAAALGGASIVTAIAVAIAIRFDRRVMLLGLLGGYLSPLFVWVVGTSGDLVPYYVDVLLVASLVTIRRFGWWGQRIPALIGPALWAAALMLWTGPVTLAAFYLSLAVIAAAIALIPLRNEADAALQRRDLLQLGVLLSAALLWLGFIVGRYDIAFVVAEVLLSAGTLLLIQLDATKYRLAWIITLASALLTLVFWQDADKATLLGTTLVLGALHLGALAIQFRRGGNVQRSSLEIAALSVIIFLILLVKLDGWIGARDVPYAWATVALLVAALFAGLAVRGRHFEGGLPAGFAVATSAFLSFGLGLVLDPGLYALVAALQAFGLSLLYGRFRLPAFRMLHIVYVCLYAALLALGELMHLAPSDVVLRQVGAIQFVPRVGVEEAPILLLLLPGLLLLAAATPFAKVAYSRVPKVLDVGGLVLIAAGIHFLILPTIPVDLSQRAFTTGSLWFNALMGVAIAAIYGGERFRRQYLGGAGIGLATLVAVAMLLWAIVPIFSFWPTIPTPGLPVFNVALTALGLPAVLMLVAAYLARRQAVIAAARGLAAFGGLAGLMTILVVIRQAVHGPTLSGPGLVPLQVELYLYSGGMLLYGFALLWAGAAFSSLALRVGSLVVVLATIVKVFMYDVGGLEGLWRVGSFLGIGIALLAVSWFYGRFVFGIGPSGIARERASSSA